VHPGDAALSAIGTPFYLVFKSVFCVASIAIAAPVAGIAALSESRFASETRRDLDDGISQNCGPPYALSPYRKVPVDAVPEVSAVPETLQEPPLAAAPDLPAAPAPAASARLRWLRVRKWAMRQGWAGNGCGRSRSKES
jgi:hypothetical protein